MYIEFRHREGGYIKQWPNWTGEIPMVGDIVVIHDGDDNENAYEYEVFRRIISGTEPDKITIYVDPF